MKAKRFFELCEDDRRWVLDEMDPDWRLRFPDTDTAGIFYAPSDEFVETVIGDNDAGD